MHSCIQVVVEEDKEEARVVEEVGEVAKVRMPTTLVVVATTLPREAVEEEVHSLTGNTEDEEDEGRERGRNIAIILYRG